LLDATVIWEERGCNQVDFGVQLLDFAAPHL